MGTSKRMGDKISVVSTLHRLLSSVLAAVLFVSQSMTQVAAQDINTDVNSETTQVTKPVPRTTRDWAADIDIDPPIIDHEAIETGVPGQTQMFLANVIDDRGLTHVLLFYRSSSGTQYKSVSMEKVTGTTEYTTSIPTELGQNKIEYYIEALDTGGNRVLKGFPFFPLVRQLESTTPVQVSEPTDAIQSKVIYVLLGAAAVGLVLALAGGNDDSTPQQPGTTPLTINVTPP